MGYFEDRLRAFSYPEPQYDARTGLMQQRQPTQYDLRTLQELLNRVQFRGPQGGTSLTTSPVKQIGGSSARENEMGFTPPSVKPGQGKAVEEDQILKEYQALMKQYQVQAVKYAVEGAKRAEQDYGKFTLGPSFNYLSGFGGGAMLPSRVADTSSPQGRAAMALEILQKAGERPAGPPQITGISRNRLNVVDFVKQLLTTGGAGINIDKMTYNERAAFEQAGPIAAMLRKRK